MSLWGLIGLATLRSAVIALLAAGAAEMLHRLWTGLPARRRTVFLFLMLLPALTPALLCGYAWSQFSLSLIRHPWANEGLYVLLMAGRLAPLALVVRRFVAVMTPAPGAEFVRRLGSTRPGLTWHLQARGRALAGVAGAVWLAAMSEFDLASLMQIPSWTVRLFEARSLGAGVESVLAEAGRAALVQGAVVAGVFLLVRGSGKTEPGLRPICTGWPAARAWSLAAGMNALVVFIPAGILLWESIAAMDPVRLVGRIGREWMIGAGFAGASALAAWGLVPGLGRLKPRGIGLLMLLPALCGGMTLAALVLAVFQQQPSAALAHSPLPLLLGLCLWLLPMAWVLRHAMPRSSGSPQHIAHLLSVSDNRRAATLARRLRWREALGHGALAVGLLTGWALGDVVLAKVLAPVAYTPLTALLYNQMHYGHNATLALMLAVHVGGPMLLALGAARLLAGRMEMPPA